MNPLTNVKNITKLNEIELSRGTTDKKSWHNIYKDSAWIFIGGLAYGLTEGDVLAVFSQYGEIVNINLVRDKKTGKTKGFGFLCYANQTSTVLAVDNLNGIKLLNRTIRVDHVSNYKPPKDNEHDDEVTKQLKSEGCAPKPIKRETSPVHEASSSKKKKSKKEKKKRKKDKKEAGDKSLHKKSKIKKEKHDPGYDKYELSQNSEKQSDKAKRSRASNSESSSSGESSDESFVNAKKQTKERSHSKKIDETHYRAIANDFTEYNKGGDKSSSNRKRNLRDSESDSGDNYVKQKESKASHNKIENKILSDVQYSKHKSKHRHNSDSSEPSSPIDNERKSLGKVPRYEQHNISRSSSSKNTYMSGNRRKETLQQRQSSSSTEDIDQSTSRYNRSSERDFRQHARSESSSSRRKEYDRSVCQNTGDQSDNRNTDDQGFSFDRRNTHDQGDRRNAHIEGDRRNNSDKGDCRSNDAKSSRVNYDEQIHFRKYCDRNDRKSCDYKKDSENSTRDSSKYSKGVRNTRSPSTEREEKHYSEHKDRDDNRKDLHDKRKR